MKSSCSDAKHLLTINYKVKQNTFDLSIIYMCLRTSPVEDDATSRPSERLVRGGGDDVAVREGRRCNSGCHQPADVAHVSHQQAGRANFVADAAEARVVERAGVAADACSFRMV